MTGKERSQTAGVRLGAWSSQLKVSGGEKTEGIEIARLIGKDSDAGRDWGQEEKGTTQDEMAGWHHGLDGCEFGWTPGAGDGQGGLACCNSWGHKETQLSDWTELNWTKHSIWSCLCCHEVGPFSIILNLLVIITALWMLSLMKGDSVETEELKFIFGYTPKQNQDCTLGH